MKLYNYFISSASFRVRIALALKGLPFEYVSVHLARKDQLAPDFLALNPQALVPALDDAQGHLLSQSLAIIEWLEELHPRPALLPPTPWDRAWVRALALSVACEIHPLNNLRVMRYLSTEAGLSHEQRQQWSWHWIEKGFEAIETRLRQRDRGDSFCFGDTPGLAEVFLIPQVVNAQRSNFSLAPFPRIAAIFERAMALPAFVAAAPANQPDAQ